MTQLSPQAFVCGIQRPGGLSQMETFRRPSAGPSRSDSPEVPTELARRERFYNSFSIMMLRQKKSSTCQFDGGVSRPPHCPPSDPLRRDKLPAGDTVPARSQNADLTCVSNMAWQVAGAVSFSPSVAFSRKPRTLQLSMDRVEVVMDAATKALSQQEQRHWGEENRHPPKQWQPSVGISTRKDGSAARLINQTPTMAMFCVCLLLVSAYAGLYSVWVFNLMQTEKHVPLMRQTPAPEGRREHPTCGGQMAKLVPTHNKRPASRSRRCDVPSEYRIGEWSGSGLGSRFASRTGSPRHGLPVRSFQRGPWMWIGAQSRADGIRLGLPEVGLRLIARNARCGKRRSRRSPRPRDHCDAERHAF